MIVVSPEATVSEQHAAREFSRLLTLSSGVTLPVVLDTESGRRSAIELFDLQNKRLLSPVHMVRYYGMGRYVTFEVSQPVRVRICQVWGANAACSALFLD